MSPAHLARRSAAVALALAVPALVWLVVVQPLLATWRQNADEIATAIARKARLAAFVALNSHSAAGSGQNQLDGYRGDFLTGSSEAMIGAELQTRLRSLVTTHGAELLSAQMLPVRKTSVQPELGLRVQIRASLDKLQQILHGIETSTPLLFVERAILRQDQAPPGGIALAGLAAVRLIVELDVHGTLWPERRP